MMMIFSAGHAILGVISTDSDHYPLASAIVACIGLVEQRKGHPRVLDLERMER
jgi:hypothetical protein